MGDLSHQVAHPRDVAMEVKRERALELRTQGTSYRDIATELGVGRGTAYRYVVDALDELKGTNQELATEVQTMELLRLDAMLAGLWARKDEPRVVDTIIRLMERRAKMLGTDAPTDLRVGGIPGGAPIPTAGLDLSKLSMEQLKQLEAIYAAGMPESAAPIPARVLYGDEAVPEETTEG